MDVNATLCYLFLQNNKCVHILTKGEAGAINVTHCNTEEFNDPIIDFKKFKYLEQEQTNGSLVCTLWESPDYSHKSLLLPVIVFALLCSLLFIMICQNLREKSSIRQQYLANYKELDPTGEQTDLKKPSRVPHQEFTCRGMKINFQMCSNLGNQKKPTDAMTDHPPPSHNELRV